MVCTSWNMIPRPPRNLGGAISTMNSVEDCMHIVIKGWPAVLETKHYIHEFKLAENFSDPGPIYRAGGESTLSKLRK